MNKTISISKIRQNNIKAGQHFFDRNIMKTKGERTDHWKPVKSGDRLFIVNTANRDAPVYEVHRDGADTKHVNCPTTARTLKSAMLK